MQNKPSAQLVQVTPKMASDWLGKNIHNRNIRSAAVAAYARDMEAGAWQVTGEAVKFAADGSLIDGQHRLLAVIRSDVTVTMFVIRGIGRDAQDVMDTGAKRSSADALHLNGHKNATLVAAAARLLLALDSSNDTRNTSKTFTNTEIADLVLGNPDIGSAAEAATYLRKHIDLSPSVMTVAWMWLSHANSTACATFFQSMADSATDGAGDPRSTLIKRLASARRNGERLNQLEQLSLVVRAWNAWREGKKLHRLQTHSGDGKGGVVRVQIPKVAS